MKMNQTITTRHFISQSTLSAYLLATTFFIYSAGLLDVIMHSEGLKIYLDIARALTLLFFLFLSINITPYNSKGVMLCLYALLSIVIFHDMFILEATTGTLVALTIYQKNTTQYIRLSIIATLIVVIPAMALAKTGVINSVVFVPPNAEDKVLTAASKDTFGFWHPNQITLLVAGCLLASFYINNRKLILICFATYLVLLSSTISRTFLPIPIMIFLFITLPTNYKIFRSLFLWLTLAISFTSTLISLITSLPFFVKSILTPDAYVAADKILSYRLQIIERHMQNLNLFELTTGWSSTKLEIDSAYINMIFSQGYLVYLAVTIGLLCIQYIAVRKKMLKEAMIIALFMLTSNFETPVGASSLLFIVSAICIISVIKHRNKRHSPASMIPARHS